MAGKRRKRTLAGTHLYVDGRTDIYIWRRTDKDSGKRVKRSTGTKNLEIALRKAAQFEEEFERKQAGLKTFDCWRKELKPLAERWIAGLEGTLVETTLKAKKMRILRALEELKLSVAADLDNVSHLNDRLLAMEKNGKNRKTLRRCYQQPLKQFSSWLGGNRRHLDRDPLITWVTIPYREEPEPFARRAFLPEEVARAFLALDRIDEIEKRVHSQRPIFLAFLTTAPRVSALTSREVEDFDPKEHRLFYGKNRGKKRVGAGSLDSETSKDLMSYIGERKEGPLFLTATGYRPNKQKLLKYWRQALSMGFVDHAWPPQEEKTLNIVYLVNMALLSGKPRVSRGGNPNLMRPATRRRQANLELRVERVMKLLNERWQEAMHGIDLHAFRKTHRTWAEMQGVPPIVIDKQLGHGGIHGQEATNLMRIISGSNTGRKHYLDIGSQLFDASRSAKAVRELLDRSLELVAKEQHSVLVPRATKK